jgi:hypothetical protein
MLAGAQVGLLILFRDDHAWRKPGACVRAIAERLAIRERPQVQK